LRWAYSMGRGATLGEKMIRCAHDIERVGTCPERGRDELGGRVAVCGDQRGSAVTAEKHQVGISILRYQCHLDPSCNGKSKRVAVRFPGSDAACRGDLRMFVIARRDRR